jgi:hypothetical protein
VVPGACLRCRSLRRGQPLIRRPFCLLRLAHAEITTPHALGVVVRRESKCYGRRAAVKPGAVASRRPVGCGFAPLTVTVPTPTSADAILRTTQLSVVSFPSYLELEIYFFILFREKLIPELPFCAHISHHVIFTYA